MESQLLMSHNVTVLVSTSVPIALLYVLLVCKLLSTACAFFTHIWHVYVSWKDSDKGSHPLCTHAGGEEAAAGFYLPAALSSRLYPLHNPPTWIRTGKAHAHYPAPFRAGAAWA